MAKVNSVITSRFKKGKSKMGRLAELSSMGSLSSFGGVFQVVPLNEQDEARLRSLLMSYSDEGAFSETDVSELSIISSEVKAINNQAALLHGERIKRAHSILKSYREGAFSQWLIVIYGNRQTPYNFLQYYELYTAIAPPLKAKMDDMPRQALYTLATRKCPQDEKEDVIEKYNGETKKQLLELIRKRFPLPVKDRRSKDQAVALLKQLRSMQKTIQSGSLSSLRKREIKGVLESMLQLL